MLRSIVSIRRPSARNQHLGTDPTQHQIVRKVDLVLPTIGILYILNYVDRQNLAAAKLQGIMEDLNMTTQQFATAVSILFVGYLPLQIPSNLLITRISRPRMYICLAVMPRSSLLLPALPNCFASQTIVPFFPESGTYDHRVWKTGLPVRSAVLKPHAGQLVVWWVTTCES
ncbi:hypothetical protein BJX99DRAFT_58226 [Aspergillus californicus]